MKRITGVFDSGSAARLAVGRLHAAGVAEEDIAFVLSSGQTNEVMRGREASERTGERLGSLVADVGETGMSFLPFVGHHMVDSAMGQALRDTSETAGALAGRLLGAVAEGGFGAPSRDAVPAATASVRVYTDVSRETLIRSVLSSAGAISIEG